MNIFNDYTPEEREKLYIEFIRVWEALPEFAKHKFLSEQKCVLCDSCTTTIEEVQAAVRADKAAKRLAQEQAEKDPNKPDLPLV